MSYSIDTLTDDCYENTTVLINKLNIRNQKQLDEFEADFVNIQMIDILHTTKFENVDFEFYKNLHYNVFSDIYAWAGKTRSVNISKKGTNFCKYDKIEENGQRIFSALKKQNYFKNTDDNTFAELFTELYCELNMLHPFREGNGRIQRLFLTMLADYSEKKLDFSLIDPDLLMIATIKSVSGDIFMLKDIFKNNIKAFRYGN